MWRSGRSHASPRVRISDRRRPNTVHADGPGAWVPCCDPAQLARDRVCDRTLEELETLEISPEKLRAWQVEPLAERSGQLRTPWSAVGRSVVGWLAGWLAGWLVGWLVGLTVFSSTSSRQSCNGKAALRCCEYSPPPFPRLDRLASSPCLHTMSHAMPALPSPQTHDSSNPPHVRAKRDRQIPSNLLV